MVEMEQNLDMFAFMNLMGQDGYKKVQISMESFPETEVGTPLRLMAMEV